jgi:Zn-finger nucleic acid-binding protein
MNCPRDGSALQATFHQGIEVDECRECGGFWLDDHELGELEGKSVDEDTRRGTLDYARRSSDLPCPTCGKTMTAFNYRAHNLELDFCSDRHGYWMDAGESAAVHEVLIQRTIDLARAERAEAGWHEWKSSKKGGGGSWWSRLTGRR